MKEAEVNVVLPVAYDNIPEVYNRLGQLEQAVPLQIEWGESSTLDEYVVPGTYICNNGLRVNIKDGLPIDNIGDNARFGFNLIVTQATSNENGNHHQIIGQTLTITNRLGNETKQYTRSKKFSINNAATPPEVTDDKWSPWKELQGTTYLGQVTKAQLDTVIDNGIYTGVVTDNELLPQGSTFTLIVINNYAVNSAVGMPVQTRQVSQTFIYLPLADVSTGVIVPQDGHIVKRTGIGDIVINWQAVTLVGGLTYETNGPGHFAINADIYDKVIISSGGPNAVYLDFTMTTNKDIDIFINGSMAGVPIFTINGSAPFWTSKNLYKTGAYRLTVILNSVNPYYKNRAILTYVEGEEFKL